MPQLANALVQVDLDERFPRIVRLTRLGSGAGVDGADPTTPFAIELNGHRYDQAQVVSRCTASADAVAYDVVVSSLGLTLTFRFALEGHDVVLTMPRVEERGSFRLQTLFLPDFALVTGSCATGDHYLRHLSRRRNWGQPWCPGTGTYDTWEDLGPIHGGQPERAWLPTHHACVWNERLCVGVSCSIRVQPLVTKLYHEPGTATSNARAGCATHFAIGPGVYSYRLRGTLAEPLEVRVGGLGDHNGNGVIDWADAAAWEQDHLPRPLPLYRDVIVYKIPCDHEGLPRPHCTFAECLPIIQRVHAVSGGLKQIVYLVGYQSKGHDTGFPCLTEINERLGGEAAFRKLIEDAKAYNCVVSVHSNIDDAYEVFPEYRPDLLSRDPSGKPFVWFTLGGDSPRAVHSINHTLDAECGYTQDRLRRLLEIGPLRESIHMDACRPYNETWLPDGTHISAECEVQRGMLPITRLSRELGMDITTEDTDSEKRGLFSWVWILPHWQHRYVTALHHGYLLGKWRAGAPRGAVTPAAPVAALGLAMIAGEDNDNTYEQIRDCFYLHWMYSQLLARKRMAGYQILDWNTGVRAEYADNTWACGHGRVEAVYEGIPIARGDDRFLPWSDTTIFAFSKTGGPQEWTLPPAWRSAPITATRLAREKAEPFTDFQISGDRIRFDAPAATPIRLTRN